MSDNSDKGEGRSSSAGAKKEPCPDQELLPVEELQPGQKEISLSLDQMMSEEMERLCVALESPQCAVEILRLTAGRLTVRCCSALAGALQADPSSLRDLILKDVTIQWDLQLQMLFKALGSPSCRIRILRLIYCGLWEDNCVHLSRAIQNNPSHLKDLDLSGNILENSGVQILCKGLMDERCKLQRLKLTSCYLSGKSCKYVSRLLMSRSCHLQELNLSHNNLEDDGIKRLSVGLRRSNSELSSLRLAHCKMTDEGCAVLIDALEEWPIPLEELDLQGNHFLRTGMKMLDQFKTRSSMARLRVGASSESSVSHPDLDTRYRHRIPGGSSSRESMFEECWDQRPRSLGRKGLSYLTRGSFHPGTMSFQTNKSTEAPHHPLVNLPSSVGNQPQPDKSHQEPCSSRGDNPELANSELDNPQLDKLQSHFTFEAFHECGGVSYRFSCLTAGVFMCQLTGLGFTMARPGELVYRIIQWDEDLLRTAGKQPAGPLFKIAGTTDAVSQLHLLHCQPLDRPYNNLSAVHMGDEGMSILQPLEISRTHVVVGVSHFSAFGLVSIMDVFRWFVNIQRPINGQVLLFHRPNWAHDCQKVNVFLLPSNIPVEEVKSQQENAEYIESTSFCQLHVNYTYTLRCSDSILVQPKSAHPDLSFGKVHHPNFEIRLTKTTKDATVVIKDQDEATVWEYLMKLTGKSGSAGNLPFPPGSCATSASAYHPTQALPGSPCQADASGSDSGRKDLQAPLKARLISIRKGFIERVSMPNLKTLINELLQEKVINEQEKDYFHSIAIKEDMATALIDTVKNKGEQACRVMIQAFSEVDPRLYGDLSH